MQNTDLLQNDLLQGRDGHEHVEERNMRFETKRKQGMSILINQMDYNPSGIEGERETKSPQKWQKCETRLEDRTRGSRIERAMDRVGWLRTSADTSERVLAGQQHSNVYCVQ